MMNNKQNSHTMTVEWNNKSISHSHAVCRIVVQFIDGDDDDDENDNDDIYYTSCECAAYTHVFNLIYHADNKINTKIKCR